MAATTFTHLPDGKPGTSFGGVLGRFFERLMEARAARVRRQLQEQLFIFDNETLQYIGYSPAQIRKIRKGEIVGYPARIERN